MRLSDYVIQFLENKGIDTAFTVCGGGSIFLNDALRKADKMRYVACHHEQAAAIAAEAYARVRTGIGLCVVTSGPGGTNAITGIAGAWLDHVPVLVLSGQAFQKQTIVHHPGTRQIGVQEINIVDIAKPVTKLARMVTDPRMIRAELEAALYTATDGRPGPVWLDIPADVQNAQIDPDSLPAFTAPAFRYSKDKVALPALVSAVVDMLRHAQRPLVHVGQGVRLSGAIKQFFAFVESCGIPFVTARNANDICASDHPNYIGRPGTFAQRGANFAVQTCDLYIAIGTRLSLAQTGYNAKDYARNAKKVMVDICDAELNKGTLHIDLPICADAGEFLREMNEWAVGELVGKQFQPWLEQCKKWQRDYPVVTQAYREQTEYVNTYQFADVLSDSLKENDVIVTDMGFAFQTTHQAFKVKRGQRFFTNCGLAAMGWGLPAAVGACFGSGGEMVVCVTGDGGLMFNMQELATIAHHQLPVKIFLLNNGGYLTMRQSQDNAFDGYMGSDAGSGISFPNFEKLCAAFGIPYNKISKHGGYSSMLMLGVANALVSSGPEFVELMVDPNQEALKSVNKRDADGAIRQTAIEDAYPYLSAAEIAGNLWAANPVSFPENEGT